MVRVAHAWLAVVASPVSLHVPSHCRHSHLRVVAGARESPARWGARHAIAALVHRANRRQASTAL